MSIDRTRRFELPSSQDLNKDQEAALALSPQGAHLIIGGPGTGKSVVALLRARRLTEEIGHKRIRFLTFNRLLEASSRHLFGKGQLLDSRTLETWFRAVWRDAFSSEVPKLPPKPGATFREVDWHGVGNTIGRGDYALLSDRYRNLPQLVIDEGQDMPLAFYQALVNLGFENFYVVADQNQQMHPETCSTRQDIENAFNLEASETPELLINYRNTRRIAQLALHFYDGDPASPPPQLPKAKPKALSPELWHYNVRGGLSLDDLAASILQLSDRDPKKLIGIVTPNNKVRQKFNDALCNANPVLDHGRPPLGTYAAESDIDLDFGQGGIMVINAHSCKGLEFDTVILADIDEHQPQNRKVLMKRFYVMVTRARDQVILLRCGGERRMISELLPSDPGVLERPAEESPMLDDEIPF
jgi:superfamily I DNA/RNA helicase